MPDVPKPLGLDAYHSAHASPEPLADLPPGTEEIPVESDFDETLIRCTPDRRRVFSTARRRTCACCGAHAGYWALLEKALASSAECRDAASVRSTRSADLLWPATAYLYDGDGPGNGIIPRPAGEAA